MVNCERLTIKNKGINSSNHQHAPLTRELHPAQRGLSCQKDILANCPSPKLDKQSSPCCSPIPHPAQRRRMLCSENRKLSCQVNCPIVVSLTRQISSRSGRILPRCSNEGSNTGAEEKTYLKNSWSSFLATHPMMYKGQMMASIKSGVICVRRIIMASVKVELNSCVSS